jgi:hypothetical protein
MHNMETGDSFLPSPTTYLFSSPSPFDNIPSGLTASTKLSALPLLRWLGSEGAPGTCRQVKVRSGLLDLLRYPSPAAPSSTNNSGAYRSRPL